jgi:hypothetical protein
VHSTGSTPEGSRPSPLSVRGSDPGRTSAWLFHSVVPPSDVVSRARGTAISIDPNVPVRANNLDIMKRSVRSHHIRAADVAEFAEVAKIVEG